MKRIKIATVVLGLLFIAGCAKDDTFVFQPVVSKTVSFKSDLVPILTKNCALSGCHASGAQTPDLSADNAYKSLINGKFVDTKKPENSIVYERLTGVLTPAMPMGASNNPSNVNGLILAWIKQGAKNN